MSEDGFNSLLAQVLSAYFSNNTVATADLPFVIDTIKAAFTVSREAALKTNVETRTAFQPAISVENSVTPDALTCMLCGKQYKSLTRHLRAEHGLTPSEYRTTFGLKHDYPVVAPNYSAFRSDSAKSLFLGRKPKKIEISEEAEAGEP